MSEIKAGDLVVVVRDGVPCPYGCNRATCTIGRIFLVASLELMELVCVGCGADKGVEIVAVPESGRQVYRLPRLKRIPPLPELDDVKREEKITA